jgi:NADPH:quinone reductase-like Zn-dependent oxidoreductase
MPAAAATTAPSGVTKALRVTGSGPRRIALAEGEVDEAEIFEEWSKEVRWLAPEITRSAHPPAQKRPASSSAPAPGHPPGLGGPPAASGPPPRADKPGPHAPPPVRRPVRSRSERVLPPGRMSAVLEDPREDEASLSRPTSTHSRRSSIHSHSSPYAHAHAMHSLDRSAGGASSRNRSLRRSRGSLSSASSVTTELPAPLPGSGSGGEAPTPPSGYTALTLPRAGYSPASQGSVARRLGKGSVDLARSGKAQTVMATVEVVAGIAEREGRRGVGKVIGAIKRRRSLSRGRSRSSERDGRGSLDAGGSQTAADTARRPAWDAGTTPLAFTAHAVPPSYVPPLAVLVQVCAVALDSVDALLVGDAVRGGGVGFVPGRSFVGRAVEVGSAVREEVVRRGEWVVGLLDAKKVRYTCLTLRCLFLTFTSVSQSGGLAEFALVDRRKMHRLTRPVAPLSFAARHDPEALHPPTLEELAMIPLCGLPAYRAVRSFSLPSSPIIASASRARVVVLNAHTGAGAIATQLLVARGARVIAQVPDTAAGGAEHNADLEARPYGWGAEEVIAGEPVGVLEELARTGEIIDCVLDTVGGRAVWDAGRRLLALTRDDEAEGRPRVFTTLVGDTPDRPIPAAQDHFWAGMRSLGFSRAHGAPRERAPRRGAKVDAAERAVGYAWVSGLADVDAAGEDVRDALGALLRLLDDGTIQPWVSTVELGGKGKGRAEEARRSVPFERAPELFVEGRGIFEKGEMVVVKIAD